MLASLTVLIAATAQAGTAYVTSEKDDALTLIDTATLAVKGTVATCKRARHIQRMPDGELMVACTDSNAADVIDPASGKSVKRVSLGDEPEAFDLSPDGKTIYVSNEDEGAASFVDAGSGKVLKSVKVGEEPAGVKVSADGKTLYVTSEVASLVHVIDTASGKVTKNIGDEIIDATGSFEKADVSNINDLERLRDHKRKVFSNQVPIESKKLTELFDKSFRVKVWKDLNERCLACGNCTNVCPSC